MRDEFTLIPSALDRDRLAQIQVDGRVEADNRTWVCLRYPAMPKKGDTWCEYSLIVNCPNLPVHPGTFEFKSLVALVRYLEQLERVRKAKQ